MIPYKLEVKNQSYQSYQSYQIERARKAMQNLNNWSGTPYSQQRNKERDRGTCKIQNISVLHVYIIVSLTVKVISLMQ